MKLFILHSLEKIGCLKGQINRIMWEKAGKRQSLAVINGFGFGFAFSNIGVSIKIIYDVEEKFENTISFIHTKIIS